MIHRLVLALALWSLAAGASAQTTVTLSTPGSHITVDTTIRSGAYGMVDYSASERLISKAGSRDGTRRILLKFDTQRFIPANARIQSARLELVLQLADSGEARPLTAHYVRRSFIMGETNWYYFRPGQGWSTPGGDLGPAFATTYVRNAVGATHSFDLTELVQRSVNGDFGSRYTRLALVDTGASSAGSYKAFHSTRAANRAYRPRLVVTYTAAAGTAAPRRPPEAAPSPDREPQPPIDAASSSTLRVMQWNIKNTQGSDGRCDPQRIVNTIAAHQPDVVSLNEVKFHAGQCSWSFDMGEKLQSLLSEKTGETWYRQHVNVKGGGRGAGNVLLSRYRPASSSSTLLSYERGIAQIGIVVNGRTVNVFSTHVEYFNSSWRPIQIKEAVRWMNSFSEPRIMMGDFNTWPRTSDYYLIAAPYQDAWAKAQNAGTASAYNGSGSTHGGSRFDYVFYSNVAALAIQSVKVPDTRIRGVYPSDHDPVVAAFAVK